MQSKTHIVHMNTIIIVRLLLSESFINNVTTLASNLRPGMLCECISFIMVSSALLLISYGLLSHF